jgi:predicted NUDIX family NTP pyrophosphohydrolase
MAATSSALLLFRLSPAGIEVFLVHPGGPYFHARDDGWWTLPKGLVDPGEDPLDAARREFAEETSFMPPRDSDYLDLGSVQQRGGKVVQAWAVEGDCDPELLRSNTFELEWPPRSGKKRAFPEVDRGAFFTLDEARRKILPAQIPFLDRLVASLSARS